MFRLSWNLPCVHAPAIYFHQFVCDRGGQSLAFSEFFSEIGFGLRQVFHYELKLVYHFSLVLNQFTIQLFLMVFVF